MNIYEQYIKHEKEGDFSNLIETQKGCFSVRDIFSMLKYLHRKIHGRTKMPKLTIGAFNTALRKLRVKQSIVFEHQNNIFKIKQANEFFKDKKVIYMGNYNDSSSGPSVFDTAWDGSHKIHLKSFDYVCVNYRDYEEINGYFFFKVKDVYNFYLVFDKKGFDYLMFDKLNHEQRTAKQFIEFIGETLESMKIKTRYELSSFFKRILKNEFGKVAFKDISTDSAEATIQTKNGEFVCKAYFDGFERKDVMREILGE